MQPISFLRGANIIFQGKGCQVDETHRDQGCLEDGYAGFRRRQQSGIGIEVSGKHHARNAGGKDPSVAVLALFGRERTKISGFDTENLDSLAGKVFCSQPELIQVG